MERLTRKIYLIYSFHQNFCSLFFTLLLHLSHQFESSNSIRESWKIFHSRSRSQLPSWRHSSRHKSFIHHWIESRSSSINCCCMSCWSSSDYHYILDFCHTRNFKNLNLNKLYHKASQNQIEKIKT